MEGILSYHLILEVNAIMFVLLVTQTNPDKFGNKQHKVQTPGGGDHRGWLPYPQICIEHHRHARHYAKHLVSVI